MKRIQVKMPNGEVISLYHANNFFTRFLGLMGRKSIPGDGLFLDPCNSVHMFFMRIPIDIVMVRKERDGAFRILKVVVNARPWHWISPVRRTTHVLELRKDSAKNLEKGLEIKVV